MSKPNSPKSPKSPKSPQSPKDVKAGGEKKALDLGELMERLDEATAKTIEDYSELFVTNVKEQRTVLEDCRDYIDKLGHENAAMVENFKRRDEEVFALQEVQTEEIAQQKARIEDLEAELTQKGVEIEELHAIFKIEMRQVIEAERLKRRQMQVKFGARVEELHNRLESLKNFMERQDEVEARMAAAEKETEETRSQMADLAPGFERKYIEKCLAYKEETDKKLEEFMLKVKEEIGFRVGDRVKEVLAQNERLLLEIHTHTTSTTGLQEEIDWFKAVNRKLRGEIDLKVQAEELHSKRNRHQRRVIRHYDSKIQTLETSLQQVMRQFGEERRILQEQHAYVVAEVKADNMKLKSIVLQKARELKKFRHLAEMVIRQRGEVELFLLDSIQYVKNQIFLQKKIQSYQTADIAPNNNLFSHCSYVDSFERSAFVSTLPRINHNSHGSHCPASWPGARPWPRSKNPNVHGPENNGKAGGVEHVNLLAGAYNMSEAQAEAEINYLDGSHDPFTIPVVVPMIDISDLSWEKREKVLRYLFKKINTARNGRVQAQHAKRTREGLQGAEPEKFQGYVSEAGRSIV